MGVIDILILLIFIISIVFGYRKGVIVQLGAVFGIIAGIIACRLFGNLLSNLFVGKDASADDIYVSGIFSNVVVFIIAFVAALLLSRMVKLVSKSMHLSVVDRIAGAVFSLFEWMFVFSLLLNIWQSFQPDTNVIANAKMMDGKPAEVLIDLAPRVIGSQTAQDLYDAIDSVGRDDRH